MKKLLVAFTVMVAIFGLTSGAFGAWGDPICTDCSYPGKYGESCELENIPCPGEQEACYAFDWDARYGYCDMETIDTDQPCHLIFNICNCEDPNDFVEGQTIGIKMTILVNGEAGENGAYWSNGATANVAFGMFASETLACAGTLDRNFGTGTFVRYSDGAVISPASLVADPNCTVPWSSQATVICTDIDQGYTITAQDELDKLSHWKIDVAPIRTDLTVTRGDIISVKIELLNQESGGICADCTAVCECEIDVAIVCCESEVIPLPTSFGMYFPYVTDGGNWNTGIVVSNIGSMLPWAEATVAPADMEVTLILTDQFGDKFTYTKTDFLTTNWGFDLGSILSEFSGTPAAGPMWLEVQTNFLVDGYCYIENGVFGMGTLARQWSTLLQIYEEYATTYGLPMDFSGGLDFGAFEDAIK